MSNPLLSRRHLIAAAGLLPLGGCSMLSDSPAAQMYRLSPTDLDPADAPIPQGSLAIGMPTASQNLDSDRIALTRGITRFDYFADATWTDRVPVLLQNLLVQAFETDGRIADVWVDTDAITAGYLLQTEVRAFTARYGSAAENPPVVEINLDARLLRLPSRQVVAHAQIAEQATAERNDLATIIRAFDVASGKTLNHCVAWTLSAMRRT